MTYSQMSVGPDRQKMVNHRLSDTASYNNLSSTHLYVASPNNCVIPLLFLTLLCILCSAIFLIFNSIPRLAVTKKGLFYDSVNKLGFVVLVRSFSIAEAQIIRLSSSFYFLLTIASIVQQLLHVY